MIGEFRLDIHTSVSFGIGVRHGLPDLLVRQGFNHVAAVVDHGVLPLAITQALLEATRETVSVLEVIECDVSEPTYDDLERFRRALDLRTQVVVGIGGGSTIDAAKAMAVLVHNTRSAISYRGFDQMDQRVLPIIAIPTTAGTGSEITPNASFVDARERRKLGINGEAVRPAFAFLDPEFTVSCPQKAAVSAAVDSLVHAIESFVGRSATEITRFFAREGFRRVIRSLPGIITLPNDLDLRADVMFGAFLSGVALMHGGSGPAAALSYPLGTHYRVPHGIAGGMFLPAVARHNIELGATEYGLLVDPDAPPAELPRLCLDLVDVLDRTWRHVSMPTSLSEVCEGVPDRNLIVADVLDLQGALNNNPLPFGEAEIRAVLDAFS